MRTCALQHDVVVPTLHSCHRRRCIAVYSPYVPQRNPSGFVVIFLVGISIRFENPKALKPKTLVEHRDLTFRTGARFEVNFVVNQPREGGVGWTWWTWRGGGRRTSHTASGKERTDGVDGTRGGRRKDQTCGRERRDSPKAQGGGSPFIYDFGVERGIVHCLVAYTMHAPLKRPRVHGARHGQASIHPLAYLALRMPSFRRCPKESDMCSR